MGARLTLLAAVLALCVAATAQAQTTVTKWQDLQPYIAAQTAKLNEHTATIKTLQARVASLEHDLPIVARVYNDIVIFGRDQACRWNAKIAGWLSVLPGVEPTPLGSYVCPNPMPAQAAPVPTPITFAP